MVKFMPQAALAVGKIGGDMVTFSQSKDVARLSPEEMNVVRELRSQLAPHDAASMAAFGAKIGENWSGLTDTLLEHTSASDITTVGPKMAEIVTSLRSLNMGDLANRSKVPVIGKWLDKLKNVRGNMMVKYDAVKGQIDASIAEVEKSCTSITNRMQLLEDMYAFNLAEYRQLRLHIVAAKLEYEHLTCEKAAFEKSLPEDAHPYDRQQLAEAKRYLTNLGMSISNMERLEYDAIQFGASVRIVQQGGEQLLDKFGMLKKYTFPAWKKKFALALANGDNEVGASVASMIDDANNQFARDTATALKQSSIEVAKANQRGVYDIETFDFINSEMMTSINEVAKITEQGDKDRQAVSLRLAEMKQNLQLKLS